MKFFARYPLHAKLYLAHLGRRSGHPAPRFPGIEQPDLQWAGAPRGLNVDVTDHDATAKLLSWFEDLWNDDLAVDVTDDLIAIIEDSWVSETQPDPFIVYLKLAYELSSDAREGLRDYDIPASLRGILLATKPTQSG